VIVRFYKVSTHEINVASVQVSLILRTLIYFKMRGRVDTHAN